jgi:hypothetical protein
MFWMRGEQPMSDNKEDRGSQDRRQVAGEQDYEVRHFAENHDISTEQARQLVKTHGNDRETLEQAIRRMRN